MGQYFDNDISLPHRRFTSDIYIFGRVFTLESDAGVFSKGGLDDGTRLLLETIAQADLGTSILDMGCGAGPIGLILASISPSLHVTLVDVNERALACAKKNAETLGVAARCEIVLSDVYHSLDSQTYDAIVSNPPIRAGKRVTYAIYDGAYERLVPGGKLIFVIRVKQGAYSALAHVKSLFGRADIIARKKGYCVIEAVK